MVRLRPDGGRFAVSLAASNGVTLIGFLNDLPDRPGDLLPDEQASVNVIVSDERTGSRWIVRGDRLMPELGSRVGERQALC